MIMHLIEEVDDRLNHEACGCPSCSNQIQPGHFSCNEIVNAKLLSLEKKKIIRRAYINGKWSWFCVTYKLNVLLELLKD